MVKLLDILNEMYPPYKANMVSKVRYKASDVWTNDPETIEELITNTKIICDNCGWSWKKDDGGKDLYICHKCGHDNNPNLEEADPKVGTGKKPKGSGRRLYTDEDPTDTVSIRFKTVQDIKNTLSKSSFKSKSHVRQSQIINLIHQRVRAAYNKAKDPEVKARLKRGLIYITAKKEASKEKTERLRNQKENLDPKTFKDKKTAIPYGSGYSRVQQNEDLLTEKCWKGYTQKGFKTMFGKRYPNCIKNKK